MSGGSSSGKGFGTGKGKGARKGPPIVWEESLGPDFFPEPICEFLAQTKREFTKETPLRQYHNRKEEWPKCMHNKDYLVQMCGSGTDRGRRFFKRPRAWIISMNTGLFNTFVLLSVVTYMIFLF